MLRYRFFLVAIAVAIAIKHRPYMKLWILSDLHNEFGEFEAPAEIRDTLDQVDVIVLAGDIDVGRDSAEWAKRCAKTYRKPVVLVAGNHEFYGGDIDLTLTEIQAATRDSAVHVLENTCWIHQGVRFLGCTLWTDFMLSASSAAEATAAMQEAGRRMNDYRLIQADGQSRLLEPTDTQHRHRQSRAWLTMMLRTPFAGRTVVVTHHAPSPRSVDAAHAGDALSPAYVSDLEALMGPDLQLWVHGHKHVSFDYRVNGVRVLCNPRGYTPRYLNPGFEAGCVVEV